MSIKKRNHSGFVLITVLGTLALLAIICNFIHAYVEKDAEISSLIKAKIENELNTEATLSSIIYIINTKPLEQNFYTLDKNIYIHDKTDNSSNIYVNSKVYKGVGKTIFSIQDEGSLISLLDPDRDQWTKLLSKHNMPLNKIDKILDELMDYTDHDNLKRLNGATDEDYIRAGEELPSHRPMISPGQFFNLLSVSNEPRLQEILPFITARSGQLRNLNTAPLEVLQSTPGIDDSLAQSIIHERDNKPFLDLADANIRLGALIPIDPMSFPLQASQFSRIQIWPDITNCRQVILVGISSTPLSNISPWEIDYYIRLDYEKPCPAYIKTSYQFFEQ